MSDRSFGPNSDGTHLRCYPEAGILQLSEQLPTNPFTLKLQILQIHVAKPMGHLVNAAGLSPETLMREWANSIGISVFFSTPFVKTATLHYSRASAYTWLTLKDFFVGTDVLARSMSVALSALS
jgi:hypothetical protein